jgi:hypothetical protein
MQRVAIVVGWIAVGATPATAQWLGMPVWNSPMGGTRLTISGDYGKPNEGYGSGTAWAGRASLGLGALTLTAGVGTYRFLEGGTDPLRITSWGGQASFRVIGGTLLPAAVNLQAGVVQTSEVELGHGNTYVTGAVGLSVPLPTPMISIEPYFSPGVRYRDLGPTNGSSTQFGYVIGANASFGRFGAHVAYDHENRERGGSMSVLGLGVHMTLRLATGL